MNPLKLPVKYQANRDRNTPGGILSDCRGHILCSLAPPKDPVLWGVQDLPANFSLGQHIATALNGNGWTAINSVEDWPQTSGHYLVSTRSGHVEELWFRGDAWFETMGEHEGISERHVLAWQAKPAPYQPTVQGENDDER